MPAVMDRIKQHFEEEAQDFDRIILQLIPGYARMVEALVAALPFESAAPIHIIDLGCGTGTVAKAVLEAFPNAHVTCLDLAENMIAMARAKLARFPNVSYVVGDFASFDGAYDAVVSSLALHHLVTDEDKMRFYQRIFARLLPGGAFYNGDVVLGASAHLQAMYMRQWRAFMQRTISDEEIEGKWFPKYQSEDRPARLLDHLKWLRQAGFSEVDVLWKRYNFAVYGGRKQ
jgi:tRNA (cmo5U34)-methyltransferase